MEGEAPGNSPQISLERPITSYNTHQAFYAVFSLKGAIAIQGETIFDMWGSC